MKKTIIICGLCLLAAGMAAAQDRAGGTMYVAAKTLDLKSSTGFFAKTTAKLSYGTQVVILQASGSKWRRVCSASNSSISGWTALSNLTTKRVVSGTSSTASAREVALAGKGFNQEVESVYKTKGRLNYADVDRTEAQTVDIDDLYNFIVDGHLLRGDE